jgi:DNA-binding GntR family transcriptional regulator
MNTWSIWPKRSPKCARRRPALPARSSEAIETVEDDARAMTTTQPLEPIEHATLSEHAYAQIRQALMSGRFEPGEKLTLRGLSEQLNISPTPIREALRRLAAEHGVEIAPNRFIRVPLMTSIEIRELREIRTSLEGLATERAVPLLSDGDIAALRKHDATIRKLRDKGAIKPIISTIQQFHFTIYRASEMPSLVRMIESLWLRTAPYVNLLFPGYSGVERGNLRAMILTAVERRDAVSARRLMEADIGGALDYIIGLSEEGEAGHVRQ